MHSNDIPKSDTMCKNQAKDERSINVKGEVQLSDHNIPQWLIIFLVIFAFLFAIIFKHINRFRKFLLTVHIEQFPLSI